jgi:hypothetical protein
VFQNAHPAAQRILLTEFFFHDLCHCSKLTCIFRGKIMHTLIFVVVSFSLLLYGNTSTAWAVNGEV